MTDWSPPPPGDTREQLPAHLLDLIRAVVHSRRVENRGLEFKVVAEDLKLRHPDVAGRPRCRWPVVRSVLRHPVSLLARSAACSRSGQHEAPGHSFPAGGIAACGLPNGRDRLRVTRTVLEGQREEPQRWAWPGLLRELVVRLARAAYGLRVEVLSPSSSPKRRSSVQP